MYWLTKIAQHKIVVVIMAAFVFSLLLSPMVFAKDLEYNKQFGLTYGAGIGLGKNDVRDTIADIIGVALGLLGVIAVIIILWGGFSWMTAGGNDEKVTQARKIIFSGIIGLAIILSAWAIAKFVLEQLATATGATGDLPS